MLKPIQRLSFAKQARKVANFPSVTAQGKQSTKPSMKKERKDIDETNSDKTLDVIESDTPRLRMAASLNKRKHRQKHHRIILEGWCLVKEALMAKAEPLGIFYTDPKLLNHINTFQLPKNYVAKVSKSTMEGLSNVTTPPGIVGVFKRPRQGEGGALNQSSQSPPLPLTVLCDSLKDPTNIGTLVRVCAAAGCESFITSTGCVDVWDPKVLRCAAGGHFHVPLYYNLSWEEIKNLITSKRIFLADNHTPDERNSVTWSEHYQVDWTLGPSVLVIGCETTGLGETVKNIANENNGQIIHVPMASKMDSLSAAMAGTVIIYEAHRQVISATQERG